MEEGKREIWGLEMLTVISPALFHDFHLDKLLELGLFRQMTTYIIFLYCSWVITNQQFVCLCACKQYSNSIIISKTKVSKLK